MTHIIQIQPSGHLLFVTDGEKVLEAAIRQGYEFPYSCGSGTCGTCIGRVLSGSYTYSDVKPYALDDVANGKNFALFCSVKPTSDMIIEIEDVYGPEFLPIRKAAYAVSKYHLLKNNVYQIFLTPKNKPIQYHAGQYIKIIGNDGTMLPFSIANEPSTHQYLELQIKAVPDNIYTCQIIEKIKAKNTLQLRGPYGKAIYRSKPNLPIIFIAGGTGIAPLKAIIEQAFVNNDRRKLHLYWGGKSADALYLSQHMQALAKTHNNFDFTPVVNNADAYWQGATGLVHKVVAQHHANLHDYQVYASGPTKMVYAALDVLIEKGLRPPLLFSDTFEYAPREKCEKKTVSK